MLKIALRLLLLFIMVLCFSCEEQGLIVNCPDCTADEPVKTVLEAKLDPDSFYDAIIQIWEGNLEDSILLGEFAAHRVNVNQDVMVNKKYTITATYFISGKYYTAVDSATPRVKYNKEQCDEPCYFVYDKILDLRLKYTK